MDPHKCEYCQQFVLDFRSTADGLESRYTRIDCSAPFWISRISHIGRGKCAFVDFLFDVAVSGEIRVRSHVDKQGVSFGPYRESVSFRLVADADDPVSLHIRARPIHIQTASEKTFELARRWLKECLTSHEDCSLSRSDQSDFNPTRVIEVVSDGGSAWHVRLFQTTTTTKIDYIALSYCWGGPQTMLTTKAQDAWKDAIPLEELSQTIKDAIYVCIQLGFKYLWVDALCILQDDAADKVGEIAAMADVYGAATLTLAACHAKAATHGFLHDRVPTDYPNHVFRLPVRCPNGELGTATLFRAHADTAMTAEPLDTRGWTLQERYLSGRLLEFKKLQLRWTCPTISLLDALIDGWWNSFEDAIMPVDFDDDALTMWIKIVYAYTLRKLTVPADRILAISGIAKVLGSAMEGAYWAGLWEANIALCLMWKATHEEETYRDSLLRTEKGNVDPAPRPAAYQGPSWSWMAINTVTHYDLLPKDSCDIRIEVMGCEIELVDERAPYGAVKAARLHIRGRTKMGILRYSPGVVSMFKEKWILDAGLARGTAYARLDAFEPEFALDHMFAFPVRMLEIIRRVKMINDRSGDATSEGLILRQMDSQRYCRLGTFAFYVDANSILETPRNTWFDGFEIEELCLI